LYKNESSQEKGIDCKHRGDNKVPTHGRRTRDLLFQLEKLISIRAGIIGLREHHDIL
jgi:hypothetical protein